MHMCLDSSGQGPQSPMNVKLQEGRDCVHSNFAYRRESSGILRVSDYHSQSIDGSKTFLVIPR